MMEQSPSSSGQQQQSSANQQGIILGAQQQQQEQEQEQEQEQQSLQQMQSPMFTFLWPMVMGPGSQGGFVQATDDTGAPHADKTWLREGGNANVVAGTSQGYAASGTTGQMVGSVGMVHDPSSIVGFQTGSMMQEMMAGMNRSAMGLQHIVHGQPGWGNYHHHQNMLDAEKRNRSDGGKDGKSHFESKEEKRRRQVREAAYRYREKKKNAKRDGSMSDGYKVGGDEAEIPGESKEDKRRRQLNKAAQRYRDKKRLLNNQSQARASGQVGGMPLGVPIGMPTGVGLSMGVQTSGVLQGLQQGGGASVQGGAIQAGVMTGGIPMGAPMLQAIGNAPMSLPAWPGLQPIVGRLADDRGQGGSVDSLVEPAEGSGATVVTVQ